jgi:hypothetical protein
VHQANGPGVHEYCIEVETLGADVGSDDDPPPL